MKELVEVIAKALVDCPDEVSVSEKQEGRTTVLELHVAECDMGKVIGKQGRIAKSDPFGCKKSRSSKGRQESCYRYYLSSTEEGTVIRKDGTALFFSAETVVKLKKAGRKPEGDRCRSLAEQIE